MRNHYTETSLWVRIPLALIMTGCGRVWQGEHKPSVSGQAPQEIIRCCVCVCVRARAACIRACMHACVFLSRYVWLGID